MDRIARLAGALVALALAAPLATAQTSVYRWVDKDGKVHFSDQPPPQDVKNVQQKRVGGGYQDDSNLSYATQMAMKKSPVTLWGAPSCGEPCVKGRELLAKRGIPFSERDAQNNAADAEALQKLVGSMDVPVLTLGDNKVRGFEEGTWNSALDAAGYPRTVLPGQRPPPPPPKKPDTPPAPPAPAEAPK
jgi:glutaredoxin